MNFKEIETKKLARTYEFTLTKVDLDQKVETKLEIARASFQMKGFRKGRTPLKLMKKMFGNSTKGEVVQDLVDGSIREHLEKSGHKPASRPSVDLKSGSINENVDLVFSFKYEILPEIPKFDYDEIVLDRYNIKVEQTAISTALNELAKSASTFHPKSKNSQAQLGDQVVMDFKGFIDGKIFDGGSADDYPVVLGSNSFIPGFEEQLVGCKVGKEIEVKVKFPKEYNAKNLAEKDALFVCKIKSINKAKPAAVNDELAVKFSAKNLSELKNSIKDRLTNEYTSFSKSLLKKDLMDVLEKNVKFELPQSLVDAEVSQIAASQPGSRDDKPEQKKVTNQKEKKVSTDQTKLAKRRVTLGLFFAEEGKRNGIEVSEKEYKEAVMEEVSKYPGKEQDFLKFLDDNPSAKEQISAPIFEEKVFDFMIGLIKLKEKDISLDQFKKKFDKSIGN